METKAREPFSLAVTTDLFITASGSTGLRVHEETGATDGGRQGEPAHPF